MGRTLSAKQVLTIKRRTIRLGGIWDDCVGEIDRTGVVFFWGNSGNGKTSAVVSFCKALCAHGKVLYLPLEEGLGGTTQDAIRRYRADECGSRFQYNDSMSSKKWTNDCRNLDRGISLSSTLSNIPK